MLSVLYKIPKLFLLIVFLGCAAQGPASGGPEDLEGPEIINIFPQNGTKNLNNLDKIEILFNELIDPLSVPAAIKINPSIDYKVKTRGKKIIIILKESILIDKNIYRINISKTIRDYRGNGMKSPLNIVYSTKNYIPQKYISGSFFNIDNKAFYTAGLYHFPISDSSKPKLIVEVNDDGKFLFNYLESGLYSIVGMEGKLTNFKEQIRYQNYGMLSSQYLDLTDNEFLDNEVIYIDKPIENQKIKSIDFFNMQYGKLKFDNGDFENYIIPWKDKINKLPYKVGDTISINIERSNHLETYYTPDYKFILPEINDTISPKILSTELNEMGLDIYFSEPIQKWKNILESESMAVSNYKIWGITQNDTLNLEYYFLDPMSLRISMLDSLTQVQIFNYNIKDIYENELLDSLVIVPINYTNDIINEEDLGSIMGEITYSGNEKIVLNIENIKSKLNYYTTMENNQYQFNNLPSGQYILWAYESLNSIDSNRYFSGTWDPYKRSAKFSVYPDTIEVRARWIIEGLSMEIN